MYIPFNIKTDYSLMRSMIKIDELIEFAKANNLKALTITDDNLFGAQEFYNICIKNDIKPIIGTNIKQNNLDIILYALNYKGYQELLKISSQYRENDYINLKKSNNLLCILPYESRSLYKELEQTYKEIYVSYKDEEQKNKIRLKNKLYMKEILYLESSDKETYRYFRSYRKELINTEYDNELKLNVEDNGYLYDKFNLEFNNSKNLLPVIEDDIKKLKTACKNGLKKRFGETVKEKYLVRLKYELDVINEMGFASYFLIVSDYVNFAKKNHILVGPGRGSAVGSLVAYVLGITNVDPLKYGLLFERFLNTKRITMPDIDIDFDALRREEVINYCINKYGSKNVAGIITFSTLSLKQAIKEMGPLLNIEDSDINYLVNMVELNDFTNLNKFDELKKLYNIANKISGVKTNMSVNASGIVICKDELDNYVPLEKHNNMYIIGHTMNYLEDIGLFKMDFLALKNLTIISNIIKEVDIDINDIPLEDAKTFKIFNDSNTMGIFQFETDSMKDILKKFKIKSFKDIYNLSALARPGAKEQISSYLKRRDGQEAINYFHPDLEKVLKPTYGIIIYQEQIMQIANILAGYSLGEADILRRAMSKKKNEVLVSEKEKFITRSLEKGYDKKLVEKIYNYILKFAEYGFNKSHSVAYAYISYQMAYLKAHHKETFMIYMFRQVEGSLNSVKECINECSLNNIKLITPTISNVSANYQIDNGIILPLTLVNGINNGIVSNIISNKPYKDIFDFLNKIDIKLINKEILLNLIKVGFFDEFLNRQTLINNLDNLMNYAELYNELGANNKPAIENFNEYNQKELSKMEYEALGFYVNHNPITEYRREKKCEKTLSSLSSYLNKRIDIIVCVDNIREVKAKDNKPMAFLTVSDLYTTSEAVLFNEHYKNIPAIKNNDVILLNGKVSIRNGEYQIIGEKIKVLD